RARTAGRTGRAAPRRSTRPGAASAGARRPRSWRPRRRSPRRPSAAAPPPGTPIARPWSSEIRGIRGPVSNDPEELYRARDLLEEAPMRRLLLLLGLAAPLIHACGDSKPPCAIAGTGVPDSVDHIGCPADYEALGYADDPFVAAARTSSVSV